MRGQLRDAKIAYAIENHPRKPRKARIKPFWGWPQQAVGVPWPGRHIARARRRAGLWKKR